MKADCELFELLCARALLDCYNQIINAPWPHFKRKLLTLVARNKRLKIYCINAKCVKEGYEDFYAG